MFIFLDGDIIVPMSDNSVNEMDVSCIKSMDVEIQLDSAVIAHEQHDSVEDSVCLLERLCEAINNKHVLMVERECNAIIHSDSSIFNETMKEGNTCVHYAVETGEEEILLKLWISLGGVSNDLQHKLKWTSNDKGKTPVHMVVENNLPNMFQIFFSSNHVPSPSVSAPSLESPSSPARHGRPSFTRQSSSPWIIPHEHRSSLLQLALSVNPTMVGLVLDHLVGNPVTLCSSINELMNLHIPPIPLESTVPLVVVGDSGAGKSSIIRALQVQGRLLWLKHLILSVSGADTHKAGIIPTHFESSWFGKVVFFDLSSHREFVHEAILNCGSLTDAVFLIVINLSNSNQSMTQQLVYWLEFVRYYYSKVAGQTPPNIIIVASHLNGRLGPLVNRQRFRVHVLPRSLDSIDEALFNIHGKIEMDCRKMSLEHMYLRFEIISQCDRVRQSRCPLPSKSYILYSVISDVVKSSAVKAITVGDLKQHIQSSSSSDTLRQIFLRMDEEITALCNELKELNLLLFLINLDFFDQSWIVPDTYPFLCQIEDVLFPQSLDSNNGNHSDSDSEDDDDYATTDRNGVLHLETIKKKILKSCPEVDPDLLIQLMIHYKYCECNTEMGGYFFPHLLKPHLHIPSWDHADNTRFMFAWTIAPQSQHHYFMPHLVHHFFLQLSQSEELGIVHANLERATRTLAWGDPTEGVEIVVHVQSSQRLFVSMRSTPNHQLQCLKIRNRLLKRIKDILHSLSTSADISIIESFIPIQKRVTLPIHSDSNEDRVLTNKVRLYQATAIKDAIINRSESIRPSNHAIPFVSVDDLLYFEPYYHLDQRLRERINEPSNHDVGIAEEDFLDMGMAFGSSKLPLLDQILDNVHHDIEEASLHEQIQRSFIRLNARQTVTYGQLRDSLDTVSLFTLDELLLQSN